MKTPDTIFQTGANAKISAPENDEIAVLAYQLWTYRGCPLESPKEDWFLAETLLKNQQRAFISGHLTGPSIDSSRELPKQWLSLF